MSMTKKYYEIVADVLGWELKFYSDVQRGNDPKLYNHTVDIISGLTERFGMEDPKFDRAKFLRSCGL